MDAMTGAVLAAACGGAALALTGLVREVALRKELFDHPNDRSAHTVPTPRLGGLGIVSAFVTAAMVLLAWGGPARAAGTVLAATVAISVLGLVDDLRPLAARWRFLVQCLAAAAVVLARGPDAARALAPLDALLPWPVLAAGSVLWIVWATNLYNFMDGIDGLAGGQAVFASLGLAAVAFAVGDPTVAWLLLFLATAAAGFLRFNLPKASIFMGDVGSTAIGFFLAAVPFASAGEPVPAAAVLLALAFFVLDATITLLRRMARGERFFAAHRTHLYQRPLAHGVPHARITYVAYGGMAVAAAMAALYPRVEGAARALLFAVPVALFLCAWRAVRRLERRAERGAPAGTP